MNENKMHEIYMNIIKIESFIEPNEEENIIIKTIRNTDKEEVHRIWGSIFVEVWDLRQKFIVNNPFPKRTIDCSMAFRDESEKIYYKTHDYIEHITRRPCFFTKLVWKRFIIILILKKDWCSYN